ncbi:STE/STE20/PAKA protein kinase [Allomyces macrogynus ATCC 38327]|uniref:STE/STE20/PAKA protein kinase n=1 Tax=Allomyces macrogynus (strain ATCC 38327) TaxID=578462 RepID=A0A0L0TCM0_ALLM3|nr:STE/STE20/PAKA protein kinase [Allomyces macrogynus ATCC 38327]|eukprot:KNE72451.1 STE/STE20/PAKA protein kinase [Allomyces macrogynus ATCC 38327]
MGGHAASTPARAAAAVVGPVTLISTPKDVEQALHIEYDPTTHTFRGVPDHWHAAFLRALEAAATADAVPTLYLPRHLAPVPPDPPPLPPIAANDKRSRKKQKNRRPSNSSRSNSTGSTLTTTCKRMLLRARSLSPSRSASRRSSPPPLPLPPATTAPAEISDPYNVVAHPNAIDLLLRRTAPPIDDDDGPPPAPRTSSLHRRARSEGSLSPVIAPMSPPRSPPVPSLPRSMSAISPLLAAARAMPAPPIAPPTKPPDAPLPARPSTAPAAPMAGNGVRRRSRVMSGNLTPRGSMLATMLVVAAAAATNTGPPTRRSSLRHVAAMNMATANVAASAAAGLPRADELDEDDPNDTSVGGTPASAEIHPALLQLVADLERRRRGSDSSTAVNASSAVNGGGAVTDSDSDESSHARTHRELTAMLAAAEAAASALDSDAAAALTARAANNSTPGATSSNPADAAWAAALSAVIEPQDPAALYVDLVPYAEGNAGDVYVGTDAVVHTRVAIKQIPRFHARARDKLPRLPMELYLWQTSRSPEIVNLIGAYLTQDAVWVVAEFMDAGCLADYLDARISPQAVAYVTRSLMRALAFLHAAHRVHRDVRSDHVLLTLMGNVKLAHFASAAAVTAPLHEPVGTPYWLAPETARAAAAAMVTGRPTACSYDTKVDVWAAGCTVLEMVSGQAPYADCEPDIALEMIAREGCPDVDEPSRLGVAGYTCWRRKLVVMDPAERATAADVLQDPWLATWLDADRGRNELVEVIRKVQSQGGEGAEDALGDHG